MEGQRYYMTLHNLQQQRRIRYEEEEFDKGPSHAPQWEVWIHVISVNTAWGYNNVSAQSFWQRASKKQYARDLVAQQVLFALGLSLDDIQ
ncbi:hypothetical protein FRB90_005904 [Tulasnella sp. 427]|nr:hypothetical protein FRB90_005904 [Tulasnella sp. 427]